MKRVRRLGERERCSQKSAAQDCATNSDRGVHGLTIHPAERICHGVWCYCCYRKNHQRLLFQFVFKMSPKITPRSGLADAGLNVGASLLAIPILASKLAPTKTGSS